MTQEALTLVYELRQQLHDLPECSGEEAKTKAHLIRFLKTHTTLRIDDSGQWFSAVYQSPDATETIAFRADMDAVYTKEGAAHLCGHDGHSAILAGLGLLLENVKPKKNVVLIFQHAEETGEGARQCLEVLKRYGIQKIYGFHNIPGLPVGTVLLREGAFACGSQGMSVWFTGQQSHAACPENGKNPGFAAARLMAGLPQLTDSIDRKGLVMATLIGAQIGTKAFGSAAATAEVWLTLRAEHQQALEALTLSVETEAQTQAKQDGLSVAFSLCDVFTATVNNSAMIMHIRDLCHAEGLAYMDIPEPFRWSEDFGQYSKIADAAMVGIGAGENWPGLHTASYVFNDQIIASAFRLLLLIAQNG